MQLVLTNEFSSVCSVIYIPAYREVSLLYGWQSIHDFQLSHGFQISLLTDGIYLYLTVIGDKDKSPVLGA